MREVHRHTKGQRGQVSLEYLGFLPILLILALAGVQLGLVAYTAQQAGSAARAAARTASQDNPLLDYDRAGRAAMSDWLADDSDFSRQLGFDDVTVTATVHIPSVVPGFDFGDAEKSSTMPRSQ